MGLWLGSITTVTIFTLHTHAHIYRSAIEYDTGSTSLPSILQSLNHTIKTFAIPTCVHHTLVIKKLHLLKAELESLMDRLLHSRHVEDEFNTYADAYPLPDYCTWFVKCGQEILHASQGDDTLRYSDIYDDASLLAMLGSMIASGAHTPTGSISGTVQPSIPHSNPTINTTNPTISTTNANVNTPSSHSPGPSDPYQDGPDYQDQCQYQCQHPLHSPLATLTEASITTPQAPTKSTKPNTPNPTSASTSVVVLQLPEFQRPPPQLTGSMQSIISTLEYLHGSGHGSGAARPNINLFCDIDNEHGIHTNTNSNSISSNDSNMNTDTDTDTGIDTDVGLNVDVDVSMDSVVTELEVATPINTGLGRGSGNQPQTVSRYGHEQEMQTHIDSTSITAITSGTTDKCNTPHTSPLPMTFPPDSQTNADTGFMAAVGNHVWECFDADITYPF